MFCNNVTFADAFNRSQAEPISFRSNRYIDLIKFRFQSADLVLNYFAGGDESNLVASDERLADYEAAHQAVMNLFQQIVMENKL